MIGLLLTLAACKPAASDVTTPDEPPDTEDDPTRDAWEVLQARISAQLEHDDVPGMQVGIVVDGALRYTAGFGVTQYGGEEPVTEDTVFRWASVSKMHTAAAVLTLVEDGALDLDAPVTDALAGVSLAPGFDPGTITVRHLLTHSAALPDELDWDCSSADAALQDRVTSWAPPLYAPPGSFYNYSNSGYVWAGALLEQATGEPFPTVMKDLVLDPAGMPTATFDPDEVDGDGAAVGAYWYDGAAYDYPIRRSDCGWARPAGWLHGTATDLARTVEWQLAGGGDVLSAASTEAMHAQIDTHWLPDGSFRYGFGQMTTDYDGVEVVWHDGWLTGFSSTWAMVPSAGFGVVVVSNASWADPYDVMYDAIDLFVGPTGESPDYSTDPSTWTEYAGEYADPYVFGTIVVTLVGESLRAEFPDLGLSGRLYQYAGDQFWLDYGDGSGDDIRFIRDDTGEMRWFVSRDGVGTKGEVVARPADPAAARARVLQLARPRPAPGRLRFGADTPGGVPREELPAM